MTTSLIPRLGLMLLALLPLALRAADWQSLLGNSPFGQASATATGATGDIEFRGVVQEEGVYLVNLYNPATKTSQWIPVNGKAPGIEVKSYDVAADKVSITQAGRALTLPLKQAHVALLAANAAPKGEENPDDNDARRAQIRDMIRARMQGGGEGAPFMRNLPPEAQAMIEEFRRRRAENGGANGAANGDPSQAGQNAAGGATGGGGRRRGGGGGGGGQP